MMNKKLEKARFFYQKGKYLKAKDLCLSACKLNPNNIQCYLLLSNIYLQSCEFDQAVKQFKNVIIKNSQSSEAYSGLGQAYIKLEKIEEAEKCFSNALRLQVNNIEARMGMVDVLLLKGLYAESEKSLDVIFKKQPKSVDVLYRMGKIKLKRNNTELASRYFEQVLEIEPKDKFANYELGCIYQLKGGMERSIQLFKKVISIDPTYFSAYLKLGSLLIPFDMCKEAIGVFNKALKLKPDSIDAIAGIVSALYRTGNYQEAYNKLQPFIEKNILHTGLAMVYVKMCEKFEQCDEAIVYMNKVLKASETPESNKAGMHYVIADLYDKKKQFDYAFEHYKSANDLRLDEYSDINHKAFIDSIISTFTQSKISSMSRSTVATSKPVFIVGMPRSGTSLTEQILSCHDHVFGAGELRVIGDEIIDLGKKNVANKSYPNFMTDISNEDINSASKNYMSQIENISSGERYVIDKMPHNFLYLGVISLMFSDARIIHCKRNPRDVCLSIFFQNFHNSHQYATRLENIIKHYKDYNRLMEHWRLVLDIPIMCVQYEDLVGDQEGVTRRMLDFLGLEWDEKCLNFHKARRSVATSSHAQVTQKMYMGSMERWKNYKSHISDLFEKEGI